MKKHKILIVDDREENLFALENMFIDKDYIFIKALSGNEALKIALKEDLSLILLDVQMPEMDGFETASLLKKSAKTNKIPIIFVTAGSKESHYVLRGLEEGAVDYLFKPLDVQITRAKVATLLKIAEQQEELRLKNIELEKINDYKNKFLGIATHDLRGPVNNILILLDFFLQEGTENLTEEQHEFINLIKKSGQFMELLISNLLDVAKIESGQFSLSRKETDIEEVIRRSLAMNKLMAEKKGIELVFDCEKPIQAFIDPVYIEQVINNLLSNAVKFSHNNTKVTVKLEERAPMVTVSVTDEGQGIPEAEQSRLFKFFSRTSVTGTQGESSTGLGLAIAQKIIQTHGGDIEVRSKVGEGTIFTFTLPMAAA